MAKDIVKLAVPFRISFWLETEEGHEEYGHPSNFLNFTAVNSPSEMQALYDGLTWLYEKLYKLTDVPKPHAYLFIKAVTGGKAGAIYTYPVPAMQSPELLADLEANLLQTIYRWCANNGQRSNDPVYASSLPPADPYYNEDQYLVVTIDTVKKTSL